MGFTRPATSSQIYDADDPLSPEEDADWAEWMNDQPQPPDPGDPDPAGPEQPEEPPHWWAVVTPWRYLPEVSTDGSELGEV